MLAKQRAFLGGEVGALDILLKLTDAIPKDSGVAVSDLTIDQDKVRIETETASFDWVNRIEGALSKAPFVDRIVVSDAKTTADQSKVRFLMTITLREGVRCGTVSSRGGASGTSANASCWGLARSPWRSWRGTAWWSIPADSERAAGSVMVQRRRIWTAWCVSPPSIRTRRSGSRRWIAGSPVGRVLAARFSKRPRWLSRCEGG
jgi:hypothetical protein